MYMLILSLVNLDETGRLHFMTPNIKHLDTHTVLYCA